MKTSRAAGTRETRPDDRAASCCPAATASLPRTVSTAPSLQHAALTPAQKAYLNNIAASHSDAQVHDLIARHYLNVLRRRAAPGSSHGSGGSRPDLDAAQTQPHLRPAAKHNKNTKSKSDRTPPPPSLSCRLTNTSNQRKQKKSCSSPGGARTEDEDLDVSLSLLSVGEWDDPLACRDYPRREKL